MRQRDTILIVDDMEINRVILSGLFQDEYHLLEAENGEQALLLLRQYHSNIAMLLLDVVMPVMDGYQVLREMDGSGLLEEVPVVVITADNSLEGELRAFDLGASDIIVKPFEPHVVKRRVYNIIELYLHKHNLEDLVDQQARKLKESNDILVDALSSVIEYRSLESGQHIKRIRLLTRVLLEEVSRNCPEYSLDEKKIEVIASASALHDIGKIAIEDRILNKPGRLTPEEFEIMKTHTVKGCQILESLGRMSDKEYLQYAYNICRYHHERWDGRGYPEGLCGDAIPICAQVVSVVDAYDALTSDRVYKKAIPHGQAFNMILNGECGIYSPQILECFKNVQPELASLCGKYADGNIPDTREIPVTMTDISTSDGLSTLQMEQMKYFAMLRYENIMVAEMDFSAGSYHVVYAPDLRMKGLLQGECMEDVAKHYISQIVKPEDQGYMTYVWGMEIAAFFETGLLKQSWKHRIWQEAENGWAWYELTILRVDIEHPRQRKALMLWKYLEPDTGTGSYTSYKSVFDDVQAIHRILKGVFCCCDDRFFTIVDVDNGFLGYSRQEIKDKFDDRFINIIYAEDRARVMKELGTQLNRGSEYEIEYRVVDAEGQVSWVLGKGCVMPDEDGREYFHSILINIDQTKRAQEELRLGLERYKIIMDQANDILFEWDIGTDTISFSSNWKKKFGYEAISTKVSERIPKISHLYPEDMAPMGQLMKEIQGGRQYAEMEFRVSDSRGYYQWCKLRGTTQFDSKGRPYKAVGIVLDINDEKVAAQELKSKAERDNLTRLYNKASARQRIEQILSKKNGDEHAALFIIDIDNFKMVNDQYGHMFGDAVLIKTASRLSRLFRNTDIVSRIGGDEFMVLLQGVTSDKWVKMAAGRMLDCFEQVQAELPNDCDLGGSIGVSVCPGDGEDFQTLFRKADVALYHAKACGKKQFQIYEQSMENEAFGKSMGRKTIANTEIESEDNAGKLLDDLLPRSFDILSNAKELEDGVERLLKLLVERLQVSRAYVFEVSEDGKFYTNTFEWCAQGVASRMADLQNIPFDAYTTDYKSCFNEQGILYCDDVNRMPEDIRDTLKKQGVKSMLQCAVRDNGTFRGWVGFEDCDACCMWTISQIEILSFVSELLSLFLLKQRAQDASLEIAKGLKTVLDHQNSWVYVVDIETRELLFINKRTYQVAPDAKLGRRCHEVFFHRDNICGQCPMENIREKINQTMEIYNPLYKVWSLADASLIRWKKGEACMMACHDITPYKQAPGEEADLENR